MAGEPARRWFPDDPEPSSAQRRKQALADTLRMLIADVLMMDASRADPAELIAAGRLLELARTRVSALPHLRATGGLFASQADFSLFQRSPFSGRCNALASPLTVTKDGEQVAAHATYGDAYEGPRGSVHGGHVIGAFDDLLGIAQAASGSPGLTGTLTVRLVARTPLRQRIDYEAGLASRSGRKVLAWGRSFHAGQLLAEATGIFVTPHGGILAPHPDPSAPAPAPAPFSR